MTLHTKPVLTAISLIALAGLGVPASVAQAQEFGEYTPYYEDDALLDVTEWFDGNDYNPTDEAGWRWDDEFYDSFEDVAGDNDGNWYGYGAKDWDDDWYEDDDDFYEADDNDWFYDYYDPYDYSYYDGADNNGVYGYGEYYNDFDNDGYYDSIVSYSDLDDDGVFDDYTYYTFDIADGDTQADRSGDQYGDMPAKESKQMTLTGKIHKAKLVQVRGGEKHVVLAIQPQSGGTGKMVLADLGSADALANWNPKLGATISVTGPKAMVGDKGVVLAKSFELNGKKTEINRDPPTITGEILSTKKVMVRGVEHLMAMVEAKGNDRTGKIAVDLGRADRLKADIREGANLTFSGFPIKVMAGKTAKPLVVAQSVTVNGKVVELNRQPMAKAGTSSRYDD